MRRPALAVLLALLLLLGRGEQGHPATVSHTLAWDYAADAPVWYVDQCHNMPVRCRWEQVAVLPGAARSVELGGLNAQQSYCWQVRLPSGQVSNIVCSP